MLTFKELQRILNLFNRNFKTDLCGFTLMLCNVSRYARIFLYFYLILIIIFIFNESFFKVFVRINTGKGFLFIFYLENTETYHDQIEVGIHTINTAI